MGWCRRVNAVVDASVMIKWVVAYGESGLDEAGKLLQEQRVGSLQLIAPACAVAEIGNVLRYIGVAAADAVGLLDDITRFGVHIVPDTPERVRHAIELGFEFRVSVYDALYLALAQEFNCDLVTGDRKAFGRIPPQTARVRLLL